MEKPKALIIILLKTQDQAEILSELLKAIELEKQDSATCLPIKGNHLIVDQGKPIEHCPVWGRACSGQATSALQQGREVSMNLLFLSFCPITPARLQVLTKIKIKHSASNNCIT